MSIRLRVALVFTLALAAAFAFGGWLFVRQLSQQLLNSTDQILATQTNQAAQYIPVKGEDGTTRPPVTVPLPNEYLVQAISPSGQVYPSPSAPTSSMLTQRELAAARELRAGQAISMTSTEDEERMRVAAGPLAGHPGFVAVAAISLESSYNHTVSRATTLLLMGGGVLVLIGGIGAYWLARAALYPVERLRKEVAALSVRDTDAGVQVPKTKDEIASLAGTMNDLLTRLHAALIRQRGFVADASHELRTPLAVLGVELELAGKPGRSREDLAEAIQNAGEEVARLTRITNDLLMLARSDEDRLEIRPEPIDIKELLRRSADLAAGRASQSEISCVVDAPCGLVANVDPDKIRQAIDNLVSNALRFAPPGSEVVISARASGGALVIEVADSGPGFPSEFLPEAFERFRRPDHVRASSGGGAGLGLAIVQAIAASHGGVATARNRPIGGAAVSLDIPGVVELSLSKPRWVSRPLAAAAPRRGRASRLHRRLSARRPDTGATGCQDQDGRGRTLCARLAGTRCGCSCTCWPPRSG